MGKIWKENTFYNLLHAYVNLCVSSSFRSLNVSGRENIPDEGAVIFAPNHCNTLMDALLVLYANKGPSAYGARADIFKIKGVGSILRWLRILPMSREHDGLKAVAGNHATFNEVVDCIGHGTPFCIFSEGKHTAKHSLQPLKKGVFRIALKATRTLDKTVYIVPVGLDYSDFFSYMKTASVRFGKPINISEYVEQHPDKTDPEMYHELAGVLYDKIAELITYFPDDENYDNAVSEWEDRRRPKRSLPAKIGRALGAVLTLPFFAVNAVLCSPMWIIAWVLGSKLKDKAWLNTVRLCTKIFLLPVLALIIGIIAFIFLPWYWALLLLIVLLFSHSGYYALLGFYKDIIEDFKR